MYSLLLLFTYVNLISDTLSAPKQKSANTNTIKTRIQSDYQAKVESNYH